MIIHVDMDAFYASIEQRDDESIAGKPVAVGGKPQQRGVVAAASYEARAFGVKSAMPSVRALKLCPHLIFVPMNMEKYTSVAADFRDILQRYTPDVEPLAHDEAFLDVSGSTRLFGDAESIAKSVKRAVADELRLSVSVGVGPNKFLAKLASDLEKPDGFVVTPTPCQPFLDRLPITRLWGIGKKSAAKLQALNVKTIGDFRKQTLYNLKRCLGHNAEQIHALAHGIDNRKVIAVSDPISLSSETTFETDIDNLDELHNVLHRLTENLATKLRRKKTMTRTVGIKLRYADFSTITRDHTLGAATDVTKFIQQAAQELLNTTLGNHKFAIRLIGVRFSSLEHGVAQTNDLFRNSELERQKKIDAVVDQINRRFGESTLHRGHGDEV